MEAGSSESADGGKSTCGRKPTGGRTKTPGIPASTRQQRNQSEKERRDKLNGFISELATLVPMVSNATKPLDKVSILRLAAAEMRLHFSCLNPKKYKSKPLSLPPAVVSSLDLIEKTIGGFIIATTLTGLIIFCSKSIEDFLGYQNIDVMGNKVMKYIYEDDVKYFETKVNSVINSMKKKSKKKTKVIKAHMLQKPLPRSNDCCRPRNMIFKISVHQNDTSEMNGVASNNQTTYVLKRTRTPRDFGYSAVVLMFIEPVRLEPEIDITYIDSNQDVYFTRHGLEGEIIYADQRISTITGYMPHEVQAKSAYEFICPSDVPIALFAQRAMFTSNDGKGDIVYRLKIRDTRFIYLQSSGQIAYKESSSEISHFVCFNRLLSEEEGSQELKKFQQRFAPQIMASKMLQSKQNPGNQSPNTELAYEQALAIMSSSNLPHPAPPVHNTSFTCSEVSSREFVLGASDLPNGSYMPLSNSSVVTCSIHSSEGHSISSPRSTERSNSITSDYNSYTSEHMDFALEKVQQRSQLERRDSNPYAENNVAVDRSCEIQNGPSAKPEIAHSVNAFCNLQNSTGVTGSLQGRKNEYLRFNDQTTEDNYHSFSLQSNAQNLGRQSTAVNILYDQKLNLNGEQILRKKLSNPSGLNFLRVHEDSSISSLSNNSNNQFVVSDLSDTANCSTRVNPYHENGSSSDSFLPTSGYNNGANEKVCNGLDVFKLKAYGANTYEINGYNKPASSIYGIASYPRMNSFDSSMDTSVEVADTNLISGGEIDYKSMDYSETVNMKSSLVYQNGCSDAYSIASAPADTLQNWSGAHSDPLAGVDLAMNNELYAELEVFFRNFTQPNDSQGSAAAQQANQNSSYYENSISSSKAKRNSH